VYPVYRNIAYTLNGLAEVYREQNKYGQAEPLYQRALHIWEQVLGPEHPYTRGTAKDYVLLLRAMKRDGEADELEARFPPEA